MRDFADFFSSRLLSFLIIFPVQFDYAFVNSPVAVGYQFVRNVVMKFAQVSKQDPKKFCYLKRVPILKF